MKKMTTLPASLLAVLCLAVLCLAALPSCKQTDNPGKLAPDAKLYINVVDNTMKAVDDTPTPEGEQRLLTPREVVEQAGNFVFTDKEGDDDARFSIMDNMKDLDNARIKLWGQQIIGEDGSLIDDFMLCRNIYVEPNRFDVAGGKIIAYIPNKVMEEAWEKIQKAYKEGRYDDVYRIFQDAYQATPITEAEYLKLKAAGEL